MRELRKHIIIALVEDKPGVLNRIASKWRQRGFNIESLAVGHSETAGLSRMTFVVDANTDADQVVKQLDKVVDVVEIRDISDKNTVSREMALIKVKATAENRSLIIEVTGPDDKIDAMFDLLENYGVVEMVRTGRVALVRGVASSTPDIHELGEEPFERYPEGETPYSSE